MALFNNWSALGPPVEVNGVGNLKAGTGIAVDVVVVSLEASVPKVADAAELVAAAEEIEEEALVIELLAAPLLIDWPCEKLWCCCCDESVA